MARRRSSTWAEMTGARDDEAIEEFEQARSALFGNRGGIAVREITLRLEKKSIGGTLVTSIAKHPRAEDLVDKIRYRTTTKSSNSTYAVSSVVQGVAVIRNIVLFGPFYV